MFNDPQPPLPKPRPVISWPGGKSRMLKHLIPMIPEHTLYGEVFGGGAAMLLSKNPSEVEVLNDINGDLVSFYRQCKYHLDAVLDELDLVLNSRQDFEDYGRQPGLTEIQQAARWFIRNKLSFGGLGRTFAISRTHPIGSRAQRQLALRSLNRRLDHATIEHVSWERFFATYDSAESFFFLDPPYLDDGGTAYSGWSEHELTRFCDRLASLKAKWLFTFQDCEQVRALMQGFAIKAITRANGIGNNGKKRQGRIYREVIISSECREPGQERKGASA